MVGAKAKNERKLERDGCTLEWVVDGYHTDTAIDGGGFFFYPTC